MTEPTEKRPADHPPVPRARHGIFLGAFVAALCAVIVAGYGWFASTQRELGSEARDQIPSGMRSTPGGYRTYSYWHSGYHGGK